MRFKPVRAGWRRASIIFSTFAIGVVSVCWWLTAPFEDIARVAPANAPRSIAHDASTAITTATWGEGGRPGLDLPEWPEIRLEGDPAKRLLLDTLSTVQERLARVTGYTATFRKRERKHGVLGPEHVLTMKIRHQPFAVYFKYRTPNAGKEAVYAEGHHDNKVIAHSGGLARLLVPRLAVAPDHPLAMADSRHAITEAGLANLTAKLIGFRRMDLDDPEASTVLDRTVDAQGRAWLRSLHEHSHYDSRRPFARVQVLYDPESRLPLQIRNEDWPLPGHEGDLLLAEQYIYEDLDFDAVLTSLDFDPANPAYAFHRY